MSDWYMARIAESALLRCRLSLVPSVGKKYIAPVVLHCSSV